MSMNPSACFKMKWACSHEFDVSPDSPPRRFTMRLIRVASIAV